LCFGQLLPKEQIDAAMVPDTPANQKAYPQQPSQQKGLGFPIMRLLGLMCLSCGAVLDVAMGAYCGKQTGQTALLRQLLRGLRAGYRAWPNMGNNSLSPSVMN
jgi:hypothetical protein